MYNSARKQRFPNNKTNHHDLNWALFFKLLNNLFICGSQPPMPMEVKFSVLQLLNEYMLMYSFFHLLTWVILAPKNPI